MCMYDDIFEYACKMNIGFFIIVTYTDLFNNMRDENTQ